jgi:hypothetical protein
MQRMAWKHAEEQIKKSLKLQKNNSEILEE